MADRFEIPANKSSRSYIFEDDDDSDWEYEYDETETEVHSTRPYLQNYFD